MNKSAADCQSAPHWRNPIAENRRAYGDFPGKGRFEVNRLAFKTAVAMAVFGDAGLPPRGFEAQKPAEFFGVKPRDLGAEPAALGCRFIAAGVRRTQHERTRAFAVLLDPVVEPRLRIQRLRQH